MNQNKIRTNSNSHKQSNSHRHTKPPKPNATFPPKPRGVFLPDFTKSKTISLVLSALSPRGTEGKGPGDTEVRDPGGDSGVRRLVLPRVQGCGIPGSRGFRGLRERSCPLMPGPGRAGPGPRSGPAAPSAGRSRRPEAPAAVTAGPRQERRNFVI